MAELVRVNSLPDYTDYKDTGCRIHPSCLSCPLETCIYDGGGSSQWRREQVRELYALGRKCSQIARELGMSRRTVWRYIAAIRRQEN